MAAMTCCAFKVTRVKSWSWHFRFVVKQSIKWFHRDCSRALKIQHASQTHFCVLLEAFAFHRWFVSSQTRRWLSINEFFLIKSVCLRPTQGLCLNEACLEQNLWEKNSLLPADRDGNFWIQFMLDIKVWLNRRSAFNLQLSSLHRREP